MNRTAGILLALASLSMPYAPSAPAETPMNAKPICQHPKNPHYLLFRGRPTVLIGSGEHYGAVLNKAFDYAKYLAAVESMGLNLTRTFSGAYCEPVGAFSIRRNTLAPAKGMLLCPWARSAEGGYANGGAKFDLTKWDEAYFARLKGFIAEAGKRGVVVEFVFFCPFYKDEMWRLSPMNAANNVNDVGHMMRTDVYTLKNAADNRRLLEVQLAMVRKIVTELNGFDNLYYEICNEPYCGGVTRQWQARIARTIAETEKALPRRHLIAQNIANGSKKVAKPDPNVAILNFHYATPPRAVAENYSLGLVIADDETGFKGSDDGPYRMEGWDFVVAGGGIYSNLDYSFTVGHEDGTARNTAPGGGSAALHKQLGILAKFIAGFDVVNMAPADDVVAGGVPNGASARVLAGKGRAYAIYLRGGSTATLELNLLAGPYRAEWVNTKTGNIDKTETLTHAGGRAKLASPPYRDDVALRLLRTGGE